MKRWMALDVGTRRIGVALSDPLKLTARPLTTLRRESFENDVAAILDLARSNEVERVVVGRPVSGANGASPLLTEIDRLAKALKSQATSVVFADETLSSKEAEKVLAGLGVPADQRRRRRDEIAAALILQWYLDEAGP